jgi:hypothetical protein
MVCGCSNGAKDGVQRDDTDDASDTDVSTSGSPDTDVALDTDTGGAAPQDTDTGPDAFADQVVSFTPGEFAGFGQDKLPYIVLGPPNGRGASAGSSDVVSLGKLGEIVLGFDDVGLVDGDGPRPAGVRERVLRLDRDG